jgi:hypothetical protein
VWRLFPPTLILLFEHSRKFEGARKFILEKLSCRFVYGRAKDNFRLIALLTKLLFLGEFLNYLSTNILSKGKIY